ncbi:MAG TPA: hypothetical protein VIO43_12385 [Lutibacter sp.]
MKQQTILMSFAIMLQLVINKFHILKKWLKSAKNSLKYDLWHLDKNDNVQKTKNVLNEVICLQKDSE